MLLVRTITVVVAMLFSSMLMAGELVITDARIKASIPGSDNTAAYMLVTNTSKNAVEIVGVSTDVAEKAELHSHEVINDRMKMRYMPSLVVQAGDSVEFKPGGYHVMLISLKQRLKPGRNVTLQFTYADGTVQQAEFPVIDARKSHQHRHH